MKIIYFHEIAEFPMSNHAVVVDDETTIEEAFAMAGFYTPITGYTHESYDCVPGLVFSGFGYDACGIEFEPKKESGL